MLWRMLGADDPMEAHKIDSRAIYERGRSADAREGVESFMDSYRELIDCIEGKLRQVEPRAA